jgi:hypothetical protein
VRYAKGTLWAQTTAIRLVRSFYKPFMVPTSMDHPRSFGSEKTVVACGPYMIDWETLFMATLIT